LCPFLQLLHGFDDQGRLYNSDGKKSAWWPANVIKSFRARAECFVQQVSTD
jgi:predicted metalloendopeptidase